MGSSTARSGVSTETTPKVFSTGPAPPGLASQRLDAKWRELCGVFKEMSFFSLSRAEIRGTASAYSRLRNDHVTLNLMTSTWVHAMQIVAPLEEHEVAYLKALSSANQQHLQAHTARKAALYFVAYPAVFSFLINKLPFAANGVLPMYIAIVGIGSVMFLNFYKAKWQAMEIDTCLAVAIARRKLFEADRLAQPHAELTSGPSPDSRDRSGGSGEADA